MARIAGINIPQNKLVQIGLTYIYGIGDKFSKQICDALNFPKEKRVNQLTDDEILKIREYIDQNFKVEGDLRRDYSLSIKRLIDLVFFLNVNKEIIIERIEKRKIEEKRSDDDLDTIVKRYDTYMKTTKPVLDFYSKNMNFHEIDGSSEINQITNKISNFINV